MSRIPAVGVDGNRIWTADGAVWASWRVVPPTYALLPTDAKLALLGRVREALSTLPRHAQLLGVHRAITGPELRRRVRHGVPADAQQRWAAAAAADTHALAGGPRTHSVLAERRTYLCVRIVEPTAGSVLHSAASAVGAAFGLRPPAQPRTGRLRAKASADDLGARLGRTLPLRPVDAAELAWLYLRTVTRGLPTGPDLPADAGHQTGDKRGARAARLQGPPVGTLDAVVFEGGRPGDPGRQRHRRYLRVDSDHGTSYQTTLVISGMPATFAYPGGGEWFAVADLAPFPVDWLARIDAVPNQQAQARARRQHRQLAAQFAEYDGEPAGAPAALADAVHGVDAEQAQLAANPGDPELEVTMAFTVAATDVATLDGRADQLADLLAPWGHTLHRPTGGQVPLFAAGLPAATAPAVCRDYVQYLLPRDLAAGAPFTGSAVGDPGGVPLGRTVGTGISQPVLLDPAYGPATNRSGSMGVFGALGSGKSHFVKRLLLGTVARGGRVVTLDRTAAGEYTRLCPVTAGESRVVSLDEDAEVNLDPLRVFRGEDRVRVALGFLSILSRTTPTDVDGAVLSTAVRSVAEAGGRLVDVLDLLDSQADPTAADLRRKLEVYRPHPLARLVLEDRPPLRMDADYVCFHAPGLSLPDRDSLVNEHLARQLLPEQLLAQGLLYLVAAVCRTMAFADPRRFGAVLVDEAWALTASPQGRQLLLDAVRDGRKHNAAVWVLSQHPDDLGDDALVDLLGIRVLFRQSRGAAAAALAFMGLEPTDDTVDLLTTELQTGQCVIRDVRDRVGLVQVMPPADDAVRAALDTTPAQVLA